jgi:hypothetical protein
MTGDSRPLLRDRCLECGALIDVPWSAGHAPKCTQRDELEETAA